MRDIFDTYFFLLLLPVFAALGHDIYHAYMAADTMNDRLHAFAFSAVGWLWTTYAEDSYLRVHQNTDPRLWKLVIVPLLEQKSVVVAFIPALYVSFLRLVWRVPGLIRLKRQQKLPRNARKNKEDDSYTFQDNRSKGKTIYKRK